VKFYVVNFISGVRVFDSEPLAFETVANSIASDFSNYFEQKDWNDYLRALNEKRYLDCVCIWNSQAITDRENVSIECVEMNQPF
jgi:hypothetical protein